MLVVGNVSKPENVASVAANVGAEEVALAFNSCHPFRPRRNADAFSIAVGCLVVPCHP